MAGVDHDHLLELARDKSVAGRRALINIIADIFLEQGSALTDRERSLVTEILRQLIHDVEITVRHSLADRLARLRNVPKDLIGELANDSIEVALPILLESDLLQDVELVEIILHRTLEHQLAIAMRREVSESVSDVLIGRGNPNVVKTLLENHGARISAKTMAYLVEESKRVDTYQDPLLRRPDLGPELARRMYHWVSAALRKHILENFPVEQDGLDYAMEQTALRLSSESGIFDRSHESSIELAEELNETGMITAHLLIQTLREGEISLFVALFAKLTGLSHHVVQRILFDRLGEGLATACKVAGIDRSAFASIFMLSRHARTPDKTPAPAETKSLLAFFDQIDIHSALVLMQDWEHDPHFLQAVWRVVSPDPTLMARARSGPPGTATPPRQ